MCINLLGAIDKICQTTLGFKQKFYIAQEDEVDVIPAAVNGRITAAITMKAGKVFYPIAISSVLGKNKITSETKGDADASVHGFTFEAIVAGLTPEASVKLGNLKNKSCIVIVPDKDNYNHVLGIKDDGIVMSASMIHDGQNKNYKLVGTWDSALFTLSYDNANGVPPLEDFTGLVGVIPGA